MPRASVNHPNDAVRCSECDKLLMSPDGIKCPRCKKIHNRYEVFSKELRADHLIVAFLWAHDGGSAKSIVIRKEIWLNIGKPRRFPEIPEDQLEFPVFHLYNYLDPSTAWSPDSGCRTNDYEKPYLNLSTALEQARELEQAARASGRWVDVEQIKEPEVERPVDGQWTSFRELERWKKQGGTITFSDIHQLLCSYTDGSSINFELVKQLLPKFQPGERLCLRDVAREGMAAAADGLVKQEWYELAFYLGRTDIYKI